MALTRGSTDPRERITVLKGPAVRLPHEAEAAIRAWAAIDADVGRAKRRVDDERRAAQGQVPADVVPDRATAARLAVFGLSLLAGFRQTCAPPEAGVPAALLDDVEGLVQGHAAPTR